MADLKLADQKRTKGGK